MRLVLSCEHGGNRIPRRYTELFRRGAAALAGHRGWDPGALWLARRLARRLGAPLHAVRVSRLLVDLNRSLQHPALFSSFSAGLSREQKAEVVARYYRPHRDAVERHLADLVRRGGPVLHLAVHSFTARWQGRLRPCDVGLLYDPRRPAERALCARWRALLRAHAPELRVRRNYPYRGVADGLTTHLRRRFPARGYLGVELEVAQPLLRRPGPASRRLLAAVERSLRELLASR